MNSGAAKSSSGFSPFDELFRRFAAEPAGIALLGPDEAVSYGRLAAMIARHRVALRACLLPHSAVVGVPAVFEPEFIGLLLALGAERIGVALLAADDTAAERERKLAAAGISHVAADDGVVALPAVKAAGFAAAGALVLFSSGTAGYPKAMRHEFDALLQARLARKRKPARLLAVYAPDHIAGIDLLLGTMCAGGTLVVPASRSPLDCAACIERHAVEILPATPTFLNLLLLAGATRAHDLSSLRLVCYGAERMSEALLASLRRALPRAELRQRFGTSETDALRIVGRAPDSLFFKFADPDVEHRIVGTELWLRGRRQVTSYLNTPTDRFTADGWFRTGDIVEMDEQGWIRIRGRVTDVINVGGEKVHPAEVEEALAALPEVAACRVYGRDHPLMGQVVAAEVLPTCALPAAELRRRLRRALSERLAAWKIPAVVEVVTSLRTTGRGKYARGDAAAGAEPAPSNPLRSP